jgi:hypothetical protein
MQKALLPTIKTLLMIAIIALAIVGSLFVLDVFQSQMAQRILGRLMAIIGIWAGASLLIILIASAGGQSPTSSD